MPTDSSSRADSLPVQAHRAPLRLESERLAQLAFEFVPTGVLVVGPQHTIVVVNRQFQIQFGYESEELIGQAAAIVLPGGLHAASAAHGSAAATVPLVRFGRHKDGREIPVEISRQQLPGATGSFTVASVVDITDRRRAEADYERALEEAVQFERLVAEIVASFVNTRATDVDEAIQAAQRRIAEQLGLDRSTLFQWSEEGRDFILTHLWLRPDLDFVDLGAPISTQFPWSWSRILKGETVYFSSLDEVPDPAERESLKCYGTQSRVAFPLTIDGRIAGAIAFAACREPRAWGARTIERLRLVAEVFGGALARKQADAALNASEIRFHTVSDNAPVMIWVTGPDGSCTWMNRQWLEFVGQPMDHELGFGWIENVHPDDRASCLETYRRCIDARQPFSMEFRLHRHDGEWRWVVDRGAPNVSANGVFEGYLGSCIDITEHKRTIEETERLRDELRAENVVLRREFRDRLGTGNIVGESEAISRVMAQVQQVASTDATVLLLGETGTGKELFATQIHELSARRGRTMVRVNCAAIPSTLMESELFGREKGAFTGALTRQVGRFELADHSTIFLDEIGDLPPEVQVKLLRVLEERQIERLGSPRPIHVDTRIIAATHRNLEQRVAQGAFREDLFYRLNVFPIHVPPLRERTEDIPLLAWRFVEEFSRSFGKRILTIPRENMAALEMYSWPGNVRELRNVVERAMIVAKGSKLTIPVPVATPSTTGRSLRLSDVERDHIRSVLESTGWRIRGRGGAAERLGLAPTTLETRMAKLGVIRPKRR